MEADAILVLSIKPIDASLQLPISIATFSSFRYLERALLKSHLRFLLKLAVSVQEAEKGLYGIPLFSHPPPESKWASGGSPNL